MPLAPWQRSNSLAALNYLKDLGRVGQDARADTLGRGLIEVLEPARRTVRLQRDAAQSAAAGAQAGRERRMRRERRLSHDRRQQDLPFSGPERRSGGDRRSRGRRDPA